MFPDEDAARKWFETCSVAGRRAVLRALWQPSDGREQAQDDALLVQ